MQAVRRQRWHCCPDVGQLTADGEVVAKQPAVQLVGIARPHRHFCRIASAGKLARLNDGVAQIESVEGSSAAALLHTCEAGAAEKWIEVVVPARDGGAGQKPCVLDAAGYTIRAEDGNRAFGLDRFAGVRLVHD